MTKPTPYHYSILRVLAYGGWLTEGVPGRSSPRLWAVDGRLCSLVPRQTLQALLRRGWVEQIGMRDGAPTHIATLDGRGLIRGARL